MILFLSLHWSFRDVWLCFADAAAHLMAGSLTPPDKVNGEMGPTATTSPLSINTMATTIQTPPSPMPTPSPPMMRHTEVDQRPEIRHPNGYERRWGETCFCCLSQKNLPCGIASFKNISEFSLPTYFCIMFAKININILTHCNKKYYAQYSVWGLVVWM